MKKQYGLAIVALATAMTISFTACGGDDSSSSNGPVKVSKVEELSAECEDGEEALVGEDEVVYTCTEGKWETEEVKSSESKPKSSSSSVEESDEDGDEEEEDNEEEDSSSSKEKSSASEGDKPTSSTSKSSSSIGSEDSGESSGTGVSSSSIGESGESKPGDSSSSMGESSSSITLNPIKFSSSSATSYAISVASTRIAYNQEFTVTVPGLTACQYSVTDATYLGGANLGDAGNDDNCEIGLSNDNTGVESVSFTLSVTEAKTMGETPVAVANANLPASKTFILCGSAQCRPEALSFMDDFVTWSSDSKAISKSALLPKNATTSDIDKLKEALEKKFTNEGFTVNKDTGAFEKFVYSITYTINEINGKVTFTVNTRIIQTKS